MNRKQIRTRKTRGRVRDKCGRQMERRKRVVPREVCVKCTERSNRSCETVLSTQKSAEVIVVKEYQWCAKAWHTNSDRPNHSTGNSATANANLRTLLIETSYGYRPNKNAKDAIHKVKEYAEQGYTYAVMLDLPYLPVRSVRVLNRVLKG